MATQQAPRAPGNTGPEESTIGQDLVITGDVTSKSALVINGQIRGDVHCASLILSESSEIEGNVVAEDVVICGRVIGSIRSPAAWRANSSLVRSGHALFVRPRARTDRSPSVISAA